MWSQEVIEPHREEWHQPINTSISLMVDYEQQQQQLWDGIHQYF
jgi:hypothetical protein